MIENIAGHPFIREKIFLEAVERCVMAVLPKDRQCRQQHQLVDLCRAGFALALYWDI
jgi:hypothetical protein